MRRLPRLPTRRSRAQDRLNRMNPETRKNINRKVRAGRRRRMARDFGRRLLGGTAVGEYLSSRAEENSRASNIGIFGQAANKQVDKGFDLPPEETAERVAKETSPDISSIVSQLESLLKAANQIGAVSGKQHKTLVEQIKQAGRADKEQQMESNVPAATPMGSPVVDGSAISPLQDIITTLADEIKKLTETVHEKIEEGDSEDEATGFRGRLLDSFGLEDYRRTRRAEYQARNRYGGFTSDKKLSSLTSAERQALTSRGFKITSNNRVQTQHGGFATKGDVEKALRQAQREQLRRPGVLGRATDRVARSAKSGAGNIASLLGGTLRKVTGRPSAINTGVIRRVARPIITKALGRTAIKSIPILGAVAGAGFAVKRLIEGDPVGAGLEAASGLAGPVTAIPALIALTSRDIYTDVFGIEPERDPQVGARMSMVTDGVKAVAEDVLGTAVETKKAPAARAAEDASGVTALRQTQQRVKSATPTARAPSPSPAPSQPESRSPISRNDTGQQASPKTPTNGTPTTSKQAEKPTSAPPASNENPYPLAEQALKQKVEPTVGAAIAEASQMNENLAAGAPSINIVGGTAAPMPSISPTTRSGAVGIGNVPDPTYYNAGDALKSIYFGAAA